MNHKTANTMWLRMRYDWDRHPKLNEHGEKIEMVLVNEAKPDGGVRYRSYLNSNFASDRYKH